MQQSSTKIPMGMTELANMMAMEKVEVQCFPKIKEVRETIRNYNYHTLTDEMLVEELTLVKENCKEEKNLMMYYDGMGELIKKIQYTYL